MNQKITELMRVAGTDTSGKWMSVDNSSAFARLVAEECARIAELKEQGYPDFDPGTSVGWYIRRYFGVGSE